MHDGCDQESVHRQPTHDVDTADDAGQAKHPAQQRRNVEVDLGQHPRRCSLEHVEVLGFGGERRGDLHTAGTRPNDRYPLAASVVAVIPRVGTQDGAGEVIDSVDVDSGLGVDIATDRTDHESRRHRRLVFDRQTPDAGGVVPLLLDDFGVGLQMAVQAEPMGGIAQIAVKLRARGEQPGPVGVGCERQLVPQRRNVDGQARVVVVAPRAAEVVAAFQDHEIRDAPLAQQMRRGDPAGPGADDRHLVGRLSHELLQSAR